MEKNVNAMDDKQVEVSNEKKPYETPALTKLGKVTQLTQGVGPPIVSDPGGGSI